MQQKNITLCSVQHDGIKHTCHKLNASLQNFNGSFLSRTCQCEASTCQQVGAMTEACERWVAESKRLPTPGQGDALAKQFTDILKGLQAIS